MKSDFRLTFQWFVAQGFEIHAFDEMFEMEIV